jgi:protein-S-isoprenylcysteine O-methyltransferase Ste14
MTAVGALTLVAIVAMVLARTRVLARRGVAAMKFARTDKNDFLIVPFVLVYAYAVFSGAFGSPPFGQRELFASTMLRWIGLTFCVSGLALMALSLISFGTSFRVGIDTEQPDQLVTSGVFALTRNPIYVAFAFVLFGEFLLQPYPLLLLYVVAGIALFHRQVLREEAFLKEHYGTAYENYARHVRRYL